MSKTYRLLLADDHRMVLDGLTFILGADSNLVVEHFAENGVQVLEYLKEHEVDLVIMDINMPEMDGIECAKKIKELYPSQKIIILTQYTQKSFIMQISDLVDGCLLKSNTGNQLVSAVHKVMKNETYFDEFEDDISSELLSKRELEILRLISEGCTSEQIAEKLIISSHTVKTHRKNMLRKTGQNSAADLIAYAINNNLI